MDPSPEGSQGPWEGPASGEGEHAQDPPLKLVRMNNRLSTEYPNPRGRRLLEAAHTPYFTAVPPSSFDRLLCEQPQPLTQFHLAARLSSRQALFKQAVCNSWDWLSGASEQPGTLECRCLSLNVQSCKSRDPD